AGRSASAQLSLVRATPPQPLEADREPAKAESHAGEARAAPAYADKGRPDEDRAAAGRTETWPGAEGKPGKGRPAKRPPALPPWPGRLPRPQPAVVLPRPLGAVVLDEAGFPVGVSARLELTAPPAALVVERGRPVEVTGWTGPWPVDERWWAPGESRRRARFQMTLADGRALLVSLVGGHWAVEAVYD
ncbi:DNA polymerase Y family protein, partial [Actinoplanes sp. NPDC051411]